MIQIPCTNKKPFPKLTGKTLGKNECWKDARFLLGFGAYNFRFVESTRPKKYIRLFNFGDKSHSKKPNITRNIIISKL